MAEEAKVLAKRRPRGVILLAALFFTGGVIMGLAGLLVRDQAIPGAVYLAGVAYFFVLSWGLIRLRRWAWYSALLGIGISGYYLSLTPELTGQNVLAPMGFLALGAVYLMWPSVRARFLGHSKEQRIS